MRNRRLFIKVLLIITILVSLNKSIVMAASDENGIFNFNKDGNWKPGDEVTHSFEIENIWGVECYLNSLYFKYSYIYDIDKDKEYTVEEAIKSELIDNYNVKLYIINANKIKEEIYNGTLRDLSNTKIKLKEDIFMKLDSTVSIEMKIYFNEECGNEFQNKSLEYILNPSAFKVEYSEGNHKVDSFLNNIRTGDKSIYDSTIQSISIALCLVGLTILWRKVTEKV